MLASGLDRESGFVARQAAARVAARAAGAAGAEPVGWVERSETHRCHANASRWVSLRSTHPTAYVDKRVEERLQQGNARLTPGDWKCGDTLFIVDVIAPFGGHEEMLKDLKEKVFPEREMRVRGKQ